MNRGPSFLCDSEAFHHCFLGDKDVTREGLNAGQLSLSAIFQHRLIGKLQMLPPLGEIGFRWKLAGVNSKSI